MVSVQLTDQRNVATTADLLSATTSLARHWHLARPLGVGRCFAPGSRREARRECPIALLLGDHRESRLLQASAISMEVSRGSLGFPAEGKGSCNTATTPVSASHGADLSVCEWTDGHGDS